MSKTTSSPLPDLPLAGLGVRQGAVGAGGDDRRERGVAAELADPRFGGAGDVALAAPGEAALDAPQPDRVGELRGLLDRPQLLLVLDPAQRLDGTAGGHRLDPLGELLLQLLQRADRHLVVLEADPALEPRRDRRQPVALDRDRLPALDLGGGALGVAEVGEEESHPGAADAGAVGAGEAGQVADVGQVGDQHPVELALRQRGLEPVAAAPHQPTPSSWASSSSASR